MTTVRLDSFNFDLPTNDDCWHLEAPHEVVVRRRLPTALAQAPLYVPAEWTGLSEAALRYVTAKEAKEVEPSDSYTRVGINARPTAWEKTKGKGARVVILDNGVDFQHPSLSDNIDLDASRDFDQDSKGRSPNELGQIDNRFNAHGTACAGIIAAVKLPGVRVVGVAPEATLVPIRISTNLKTESLINALDYARRVGDVILLPRYLPKSQELSDKISVIAQEIPIVCASGNDGTPFLVYPACLPETIAVGA
jgi:subtilisin family serine protease